MVIGEMSRGPLEARPGSIDHGPRRRHQAQIGVKLTTVKTGIISGGVTGLALFSDFPPLWSYNMNLFHFDCVLSFSFQFVPWYRRTILRLKSLSPSRTHLVGVPYTPQGKKPTQVFD